MAKYNSVAMRESALKTVKAFWIASRKVFGDSIGAMPDVKMNARLTSTAGRAWLEDNFIDLSCYLFEKFPNDFHADTIPHELCHHIAYRLYGDKGHGKGWKYTMQQMGLNPARCHNMETLHQAKQKGK